MVLDTGEVDDDLVRDMTEVLTSFCARLYGRRSARNRAEKALRWYLDASWKLPEAELPSLDECREHRVLAVDVNVSHLAATVVDASGNPVGRPVTVPLALAGLAGPTRDGHLRQAISVLLGIARAHDCRAVVVENLDFVARREEGRELRATTLARKAREELPPIGDGHSDGKVSGPPGPDGDQRGPGGAGRGPGLYQPLGCRALARHAEEDLG